MADDEPLCEHHIIGDGGEAEEESSQSPPQKFDDDSDGAEEDEDEDEDGEGYGAEEEDEEEDGEDYLPRSISDTDDDSGGFFWIGPWRFSNRAKSDFIPYGVEGVEEVDVDTWIKYWQEIRESEGFDIDHYPGLCIMADYHPKNVNAVSRDVLDYCVAAINEYNQKHGSEYSFGKLEKLNTSLWDAGANYYLTFQAKEPVADAFKTFQALVWGGICSQTVVKFCRLKEGAAAT